MIRSLNFRLLERRLNNAYRSRLATRGPTAEGVFWRSGTSQTARFRVLLALITTHTADRPLSIADIGCGYGAMLDFLQGSSAFGDITYQGIDINDAMIDACHRRFPAQKHLFRRANRPTGPVDFCVFSGTFNLTHSTDPSLWNDYIFTTLGRYLPYCRRGMALNLICASKMAIKGQIFHANRADFIAGATARLGPTVAVSTPGVSNDVSFLIRRR
jgi:SAM-dependent methyltransferase